MKRVRRLVRDKDFRRSEQRTVVEGWTLIDEARASGVRFESIIVVADELERLRARGGDVRSYEISSSAMESVSGLDSPPGVLAVVETPLVAHRHAEGRLQLLLVDVADPGNVGTLIRSAEAAGFDEVLLSGRTVEHDSPKVIRAAAGSAFRVACTRVSDVDGLRERGVAVLGLTSASTMNGRPVESLYDVDLVAPLAVAVGSEAHGLPVDMEVDRWVRIPHVGPTESLNAAMAGTVACMHIGRMLVANGTARTGHQD